MPLQKTRHNEVRSLNLIIDRALIQSGRDRQQAVVALLENHDVEGLADRIRRRATYFGRRMRRQAQQIRDLRDGLVMTLYLCRIPALQQPVRLMRGVAALVSSTTILGVLSVLIFHN